MGDNNQGTATPADNTVPKQRLDELINEVRGLRAENGSLRGLIPQLMPKQATQQPDSKRLQKLKEEDPELYQLLKRQEQTQKSLSAAIFHANEKMDIKNLVDTVGTKTANELHPDIERIIENARKTGNMTMTRVDAFLLLKGQQALVAEQTPKAKEVTQEKTVSSEDAPSGDLSAQGVTSSAARMETADKDWDKWAESNSNSEF